MLYIVHNALAYSWLEAAFLANTNINIARLCPRDSRQVMYLLGIAAHCMLSLVLLSTAAPLNTDVLNTTAHSLQRRLDIFALHSPEAQPNDRYATVSNDVPLSNRAIPAVPVGNQWWLFFEQSVIAIPFQHAAEQLAVFYDALHAEAASRQDQNTAFPLTLFGKGNLRLSIYSEGVIPWFFVGHFAAWMLDITRRGFAGLYAARVVNAATGATIIMTLQVIGAPMIPD